MRGVTPVTPVSPPQSPSQKPRRRVSARITTGAEPPQIPSSTPRHAWWRDLKWWPGSGGAEASASPRRHQMPGSPSNRRDAWKRPKACQVKPVDVPVVKACAGGATLRETLGKQESTLQRLRSLPRKWNQREPEPLVLSSGIDCPGESDTGAQEPPHFCGDTASRSRANSEDSVLEQLGALETEEPCHRLPGLGSCKEAVSVPSLSTSLATTLAAAVRQIPEEISCEEDANHQDGGAHVPVGTLVMISLAPRSNDMQGFKPAPFLRANGSRRVSYDHDNCQSTLDIVSGSQRPPRSCPKHLALDLDDLEIPSEPSSIGTSPANRTPSQKHSRTCSPFGSDLSSDGERHGPARERLFSGSSGPRSKVGSKAAATKYAVTEDERPEVEASVHTSKWNSDRGSDRVFSDRASRRTSDDADAIALSVLFNEAGELLPTSYLSSAMTSKSESKRSSFDCSDSKRSSLGRTETMGCSDDLVQGPILEEGSVHRDDVKADCISDMQLEDIRSNFPLVVLEKLADFFEDSPVDTQKGSRVIHLAALDTLASNELGFPPEIVASEVKARGLVPALPIAKEVHFLCTSLSQLFELMCGAIQRVETEQPQHLWSEGDLELIEAAFQRYANRDRLPVARVFVVVEELGFAGLSAATPREQIWLAGIARAVAGRSVNRRDDASIGYLSLSELTCILSAGLLDRERAQRRAAYRRERKAQVDSKFTAMEVEDLRELYSFYVSLETDDGSNSAPRRLVKLFECCGNEGLSEREVDTLKEITSMKLVGHEQRVQTEDSSFVTFDVFIYWMKEVFRQKVGGMQLQSRRQSRRNSTEPDSCRMSRVGSERYTHIGLPEDSRLPSKSSGVPEDSRRSSVVSVAFSDGGADEERRGFAAAVLRERRQASCAGGVHKAKKDSTPQRSPRSHSSRRKPRSRILSHSSSRAGSRPASRSNSRSNSLTPSTTHAAAGAAKDATDTSKKDILSLKGLPQGEAMLARKKFRANSMDLSTELGTLALPSEVAPGLEPKPRLDTEDSMISARDEALTTPHGPKALAEKKGPVPDQVLSRLRNELGSNAGGSLRDSNPLRSGMRQEKQVTDSLEVVTDAIAKLSALAVESPSERGDMYKQ